MIPIHERDSMTTWFEVDGCAPATPTGRTRSPSPPSSSTVRTTPPCRSPGRAAHERSIAGSELRVFPNCGHWPPRERQEEFNRGVGEFLAR